MTDRYFSTASVDVRDRISFWRELICKTFGELDCTSINGLDFFGEMNLRSAGQICLVHLATDPYHLVRSRELVAGSVQDAFFLKLQLESQTVIEQDGRIAILEPGDFALYDSRRPFRLQMRDRSSQIVVRIPRSSLQSRLPHPEAVTAIRVRADHGIGSLASTFLKESFSACASLPEATNSSISDSILGLTTAALCRFLPRHYGDHSTTRLAQLVRIKEFIEQNLGDPDLSVESVARSQKISPRYLQSLFSIEGVSPSRWIWTRRLERCREDLEDPKLAKTSITAISYGWGFNDSTHFSRAFKKRFGQSPRDFRRASRSASQNTASTPCSPPSPDDREDITMSAL